MVDELECPSWIRENAELRIAGGAGARRLLIDVAEGKHRLDGPFALSKCWISCRQWLEQELLRFGAVLFRGFSIADQYSFEQLVRSMNERLFDYVAGNSPRTKIANGVYSSTEYPAEYFISLHNELSYSRRWPTRLLFCCVAEPSSGGETPLVDSRLLLRHLPQGLVQEFKKRKVTYIRNLHAGSGLGNSWQKTFGTDDRSVVEDSAGSLGIAIEWKKDGSLRMINTLEATAVHPRTGEEVWFNQADQFHPSSLPTDVREALAAVYPSYSELPQFVTFGDGTMIDESYLTEIREATRQMMSVDQWQLGDVLVIDNMLVAHGRMPFKGKRRVLVSMFGDSFLEGD